MAVTNPDKVVTKQDLADFYTDLLPYLGGNLPVVGTINRSDIWSTTEKVVGCSVDGKPIYQRTITGTTPATIDQTAGINIELATITNLERLLDARSSLGWAAGNDGGTLTPSPSYLNLSPTLQNGKVMHYQANIYSQGNVVYLNIYGLNTGILVNKAYIVTIQYIKTSDAANSFNYADENDYSTTEKIIGTWVGGETLYKKTYAFTSQSTQNSDLPIVSIDSNMRIKDIEAYMYNASLVIPVPWNLARNTSDMGNVAYIYQDITNSNLNMVLGKSWTSMAGYVTIKYTKS